MNTKSNSQGNSAANKFAHWHDYPITRRICRSLFVAAALYVFYSLLRDKTALSSTNSYDLLFLFMVALFFSILLTFIFNIFPVRFNFFVGTRRIMIADIIGRTEDSLVIFSGCFNPIIYDDPIVLASLNKLPDTTKISFFTADGKIHDESKEFAKFISKRKITVKVFPKKTARSPNHFIISDLKHLRIEFFSRHMKTHNSNKFAAYFYNDLAETKSYLKRHKLEELHCD